MNKLDMSWSHHYTYRLKDKSILNYHFVYNNICPSIVLHYTMYFEDILVFYRIIEIVK